MLATATSLTWSEIKALTLPELWTFLDEWNESPPQHLLMKWYVGYKPKRFSTLDDMSHEEKVVAKDFETVGFDKLPAYAQEEMLSHLSKEEQIAFLNKGRKTGNA